MKKNSHTNGSGALFRRMLLIFAFGSGSLAAQTFTESMGSVASTTSIVSYEAANGFDNDGFTMTGNADIRNTSASNGYAGASGLANVFFTNNTTNPAGNRSFQIEGINTSNISDPVLSFGILKSTVASDGSDFIVEVSTDGINYTPVSFPALPTGTGTAVWRYETVTGAIPQVSDLRIRWTNTSATTQYRIDDVNLNCSASITPSQSTTLCAGDNVTLTASNALGGSYLWSNSAATQSISAGSSATYTVQVTDGSGCVSVSSPVRVLAYPAAMVSASASDSTICTGDSATLHARTLTQDLIFSEYVEGSGNEKYIEIYNGTGAAVNLSDYEYLAFHNGAASPSFTTALSGTLADGATLVLKNGSATLYSGGQAEFGVQHNGNDALALYKISTSSYVDIFGVIGQDPGTAWTGPGGYSTMDHTLRRKPNVYSGITVNPGLAGANGFTTLTTEWDLYATDDVSGLGMHSVDGAYVWNPGSYSGNMVSVSPSSTTTYTVTGTFINGCTASDDVTINVSNPSVSVSASDTLIYLCYGPQSSTLTANASGGTAPYSISWSTGETTSSVTVSPNTTTTYSVTVSDNNGCTSSSSSIAVTVIDACCSSGNCGHNNGVAICHDGHTICVSPNAVAAHLAQGDQLGACDNNDHGHGHGYGDNDDHGHGHGDGDDHGHGHGNDDHGHGHGDRIAYIQGDSTNTVVNAYPNPFDNSVNVQVSVTNDEPVRVEVKDIFGRTIAVIQDGNLSAGTYQYTWTPGSDVASGVYFIDTVCGGEHQVTKLVYQGK